MLIELHSAGADCVHNHSGRSDFTRLRPGTMQCIHEEKLADASPMVTPVNREAAEQSSGDQRIAREFLRYVRGQFTDVDAIAGERVIAEDCAAACPRRQNEGGRTAAAKILSRLLLQISVQGCVSAREIRAVMAVAEGFNHPCRTLSSRHLEAGDAPVTPCGLAKPLAGSNWFDKGIHENLAVAATQSEHRMLPDGAGGHFQGATNYEVRKRPTGQIGRAPEQRFLLAGEAGFNSGSFGSNFRNTTHGTIVRQLAVQTEVNNREGFRIEPLC